MTNSAGSKGSTVVVAIGLTMTQMRRASIGGTTVVHAIRESREVRQQHQHAALWHHSHCSDSNQLYGFQRKYCCYGHCSDCNMDEESQCWWHHCCPCNQGIKIKKMEVGQQHQHAALQHHGHCSCNNQLHWFQRKHCHCGHCSDCNVDEESQHQWHHHCPCDQVIKIEKMEVGNIINMLLFDIMATVVTTTNSVDSKGSTIVVAIVLTTTWMRRVSIGGTTVVHAIRELRSRRWRWGNSINMLLFNIMATAVTTINSAGSKGSTIVVAIVLTTTWMRRASTSGTIVVNAIRESRLRKWRWGNSITIIINGSVNPAQEDGGGATASERVIGAPPLLMQSGNCNWLDEGEASHAACHGGHDVQLNQFQWGNHHCHGHLDEELQNEGLWKWHHCYHELEGKLDAQAEQGYNANHVLWHWGGWQSCGAQQWTQWEQIS